MTNPESTEKTEFSSIILLRDQLSYLFAKHIQVARPLLCGLAMAWVVISVCAYPTPLSAWSVPLAGCVLGLAFINLRISALVLGLVCTVQMMSVHPDLGWLTALLSITFIIACGHYAGRVCAVLVAPYMLTVRMGIAVPLGLAAVSGKRTSWLWAGAAYLWCVCHAFVVGHPRIGVAAIHRFEEAGQALTHRDITFDGNWLQRTITYTDFVHLHDDVLTFLLTDMNGLMILLQLVLWCAVAWMVRRLYRRQRLKDRLALEYLERLTKTPERKKEIPPQQKLLGAMGIGTACFVVAYIVLSSVASPVEYGAFTAVFDVFAAILVGIPLYVVLEGDRREGRRPTKQRREQPRDNGTLTFKNLPGGGPDKNLVGRRPQTVTPPSSKRQGAKAPGERRKPGGGPKPPGGTGRPQRKPSSQVAVARARARMASAAQPSVAVESIVFIDMVESTALGSKYGDEYVLSLKERLADIVETEAKRQNVLFSKGTGDGYMLTFPEALDAVRAAVGVLRGVRQANEGVADSRALHLRLGIHMGQVNIDSSGDRLGTAANFASRVESAKLDQLQAADEDFNEDEFPERDRVLVSEIISEELQGMPGFDMRPIGYFEFKGITGLHRVYELTVS